MCNARSVNTIFSWDTFCFRNTLKRSILLFWNSEYYFFSSGEKDLWHLISGHIGDWHAYCMSAFVFNALPLSCNLMPCFSLSLSSVYKLQCLLFYVLSWWPIYVKKLWMFYSVFTCLRWLLPDSGLYIGQKKDMVETRVKAWNSSGCQNIQISFSRFRDVFKDDQVITSD